MVILRRAAAWALLCFSIAGAIEREPWEVYRGRRQALARNHPDGVILLFGYGEHEGQSARSAFRQENNFYYLTGWNEPGASLLLLPENGGEKSYREILFLPARNPSREQWLGARVGPADPAIASKTGFADVREISRMGAAVSGALKNYREVYSLLPRPPSYGQQPEPDRTARLRELAPGAEPRDIRKTVNAMRMVKSEGEVRFIKRAVDATMAAHGAAWRRIRSGAKEYQVLGAMMGPMMELGCLRLAYPPIAGSGINSTILHYSANTETLRSGQLILIDVGGEYAHYASDITRTAPVSGKFSGRQREIYDLVLGAQKAAIQAVKPGMTLGGHGPKSLTQIAQDYFNAQGLINGRPAGEYFTHGLGHHVGLEVHDPGDPQEPLRPGMVITVEPGLYLPEERLGVRIEDMVLVTPEGASVLSAELPSDPREIGERMQGAGRAAGGNGVSGLR